MSEFGRLPRVSPEISVSRIDTELFADRISRASRLLPDNTGLIDLQILSAKGKRKMSVIAQEAASNPPQKWKDFIETLPAKERGFLIGTLGTLWRAGLRNLEEMRNIDEEELALMASVSRTGKRLIGVKRAKFTKTALGQSKTEA